MPKFQFIFFIITCIIIICGIYTSNEFTLMAAGVAFFFQGMHYMNAGLKVFSGGILENTLKYITRSLWRSIGFGIITTAIIQSSSVVSVIVISFLSAGIITLHSGIGIILGSNLGATVVAWIIALYGIKIKLIIYALPLIVFGVAFKNNKHEKIEGLGSSLLGIGFILIGIDYLKDGFSEFNDYLHVVNVSFSGYHDILLYTFVGIISTVVMQSTNALMILLLSTLETNNHLYYHTLAIAVGSNIGTTVTAVLGSFNSCIDGKRLALVHVLFNCITALTVIILFYQFVDFTDYIATKIGITQYRFKLTLFHSIFNIFGILLLVFFLNKISNFTKRIFKDEVEEGVDSISLPSKRKQAKYLDATISYPDVALLAVTKETQRLYKNTSKIICYAILVKPSSLKQDADYQDILNQKYEVKEKYSISNMYDIMIKGIYSDIVQFANTLDFNLSSNQTWELFTLQTACRHFASATKHVKFIHKNILQYANSNDTHIKSHYNQLRLRIIKTLIFVNKLGLHRNYTDLNNKIVILKNEIENQDKNFNNSLNYLIQNIKIDSLIATSLLNDSAHVHDTCISLIDGIKVMLNRNTIDYINY